MRKRLVELLGIVWQLIRITNCKEPIATILKELSILLGLSLVT